MATKTNWSSTFQSIDLYIESKDFEAAKELIDEAIMEAHRVMIDPTFLVRQLQGQKKQMENRLS
jgi:hypothetical protein